MKLNSKQAKKIVENPIKTAETVNLTYTSEDKLSVVRRKHGRGFVYLKQGKKIHDTKKIKRYKSLVIPPAWKDVRISDNPKSHLQAIGLDVKGRKQYLYHNLWNKIRNSTKFYQMSEFGEVLPKIRAQVAEDLTSKTMTKEKCLALVIRLMEETHIRVGSDQYAINNETYGLTTLRNKHLKLEKGKITFRFTGKKDKKHNVKLENKKLQKLVM